ncbi:MAG TPA: hypothetical protein VLA78_02810 [Paracoccaceae bacterium]|nr:hypothetical protein [Paracoccaceae bacterium]
MHHSAITTLARSIETGSADQPAFVKSVMEGLQAICPGTPIDASILTSTEAALDLACAAYPAWRIDLQGRASAQAGGWTCTIRENGTRDDDEVIGIGRGATIPLALIAAILLAAARRAQGYV